MGVVLLPRAVVPSELDAPPGRWRRRMWVSDAPLEEFAAYWRCVDAFDDSGLWPVLIPVDVRYPASGPDWFDARPDHVAKADEVGEQGAATVLADAWPGECCGPECLAPLGAHFPGLVRRAPARSRENTHGELIWNALQVAGRIQVRLGLVRVQRGADVPAAIGWAGARRHLPDVAAVSAVLRSWEDRFGARLMLLGADQIVLSVAAAPTTSFRAVGVAAEHRAFCPAEFHRAPVPFATMAADLLHGHVWPFTWD